MGIVAQGRGCVLKALLTMWTNGAVAFTSPNGGSICDRSKEVLSRRTDALLHQKIHLIHVDASSCFLHIDLTLQFPRRALALCWGFFKHKILFRQIKKFRQIPYYSYSFVSRAIVVARTLLGRKRPVFCAYYH